MSEKKKVKPKSTGDKVFDTVNVVLLLVFTTLIVVPVYNVVISSFASGTDLASGFGIFPRRFTIGNYTNILSESNLWQAFGVSVAKTVIGAVTHVLFCALMAYPMSKMYLKGRKFYVTLAMITMYFGGGMIPSFLLIKSLGLLNSFWVYIIPALLSYFDVILLFNFFRNIPASLEESAKIDGASEFQIFRKITLPLSRSALLTIGLFTAVGQWNDFYTALLYINNASLWPLQYFVYKIIAQQNLTNLHVALSSTLISNQGSILATVVVTALPIIIAYPFLQKYFVSGMTIGAVKE
ncbi:MAG: carbohydrate ABC transporter permease [Streptococcaceae bacterium]|jgi:putative aldouronate transport system permease protein|nr:carbohydrate ABC transporter permease [Streptococcaceae bacterium]